MSEENKIMRKNIRKLKKYVFKINKLFLYVSLNTFNLFSLLIQRLNNLKISEFITNLNFILFYLVFNFSFIFLILSKN